MGKKDASAVRLPVDQYRKQIGKQDYKKTKSVLKATRLKAEAKKTSSGFKLVTQKGRQTAGTQSLAAARAGCLGSVLVAGQSGSIFHRLTNMYLVDAFLVIAAILFFVLCVYAFFYLNLSTEINLDVDVD